jgi:alpha-1,2-mannosyltransferase
VEWAWTRNRTDHQGASGGASIPVSGLPAADCSQDQRPVSRLSGLLLAGAIVVFALSCAAYLVRLGDPRHQASMVDMQVYRHAGLIVWHGAPWHDSGRSSLLYARPVYGHLLFTYTPFAALVFVVLALPWFPAQVLYAAYTAASLVALVVALWATFGGLGHKGRTRLGETMLAAMVMLWTEPVLRTLLLGQIELMLMALLIWDMCQPEGRWWKGAGVGIAAGIKLVPLIFIPYLLLTRRLRSAAVATATFAGTIVLGYLVLPADSRQWWLGGLFLQSRRAGFIGGERNQSLAAIITRLAGSEAAGHWVWLAAGIITALLGLAVATVLDRAGHKVVGMLTCALTSLLISPVSWDHHWVWVVPAVAVLAVYGSRARGAARSTYLGAAAAIVVLFGAWPIGLVHRAAVFLWGLPAHAVAGALRVPAFYGLIYAPPTSQRLYARLGDQRWYAEYHWHGLQLVAGNLYVLVGLMMLALLAALGWLLVRQGRRGAGKSAEPTTEAANMILAP